MGKNIDSSNKSDPPNTKPSSNRTSKPTSTMKNNNNNNKNKNNNNTHNSQPIVNQLQIKKKKIGKRNYLIDSFVGCFAGFSLAWFITPLDVSVIQSMSGRKTLPESIKHSANSIFTKPHKYMRRPEFSLVVGTYGATYLTKNYVDTTCKLYNLSPEKSAVWKFWLVFAVNGGLSVFWKDPGLARLFSTGSSNANRPTPRLTISSWVLRDTIHVIGAAVLPDYLEEKYKLTPDQWRVVQLSFPVLVQLLTTPCHLLGLDFYNYETSPWKDRFGRVAKSWIPSAGIRMVRMFAPWSIGLLINRDLRDYLNK